MNHKCTRLSLTHRPLAVPSLRRGTARHVGPLPIGRPAQLMHFSGSPPAPPPLRSFEEEAVRNGPGSRVVSAASLSKVMAPGLRLG